MLFYLGYTLILGLSDVFHNKSTCVKGTIKAAEISCFFKIKRVLNAIVKGMVTFTYSKEYAIM